MFKGCLIGVASIVLLILVALFAGYYLLTHGLEVEKEMVEVSISQQAAQSFDQRIEHFEDAVEAASPGEKVSLVITEEEANSKIAELIAEANLKEQIAKAGLPVDLDISDVQINFRDGRVKALALTEISGIEVKMGVQALVDVKDGRLSLDVQDIDFGSLPLPQTLKDQLTGLIPEDIDTLNLDIPIELEDVIIQDGQLLIKGVAR